MVGREEAVFDGCRAARLAVAHEAGVVAAFRPLKAANEDTAAYRELGIVAQTGHEAAVGIARAADGHRRDAALDAHRTAIDYIGNQSTRILAAGAPGASRLEVLDGGIAHVAEGGKVLLREVGHVEGQRVAVAVEGALERVGIAGTRHRRDADVAGQLHELAAEGVAAADDCGEVVPVVGAADEVGVVLRASAGEVTYCDVEAENWPDSDRFRLNIISPFKVREEPTSPFLARVSRSRPILAIQCRAASTGDVGVHVVVVGRAVSASCRRAEVDEDGLVVALLRHAPVGHGYAAQLGDARQAASGSIVGQHFQRGAGVGGHGCPAVDGVPRLRRSALQGDNQAVAVCRQIAQDAHGGAAVGHGDLGRVQMACGADHLADVLGIGIAEHGEGRCIIVIHIVDTVEEDAVLVGLHHAVVLHEGAEVGGGFIEGDGLGALRRAEDPGVVAVSDGGVGVAGEGLRVGVVRGGDGQRRRGEDAVRDGGGGAAIFIARDAGAAGVGGARHRAVEHAALDGEAAALRSGHDASEGSVLAEVGGERHAADAVGDGRVAEAHAHDACQQFAVSVVPAADGARRAQVLDGGTADALERRGEAALVAHVEGQLVAVAVEGAAEGLVIVVGLVGSGHRRDADVAGQLHVIAAVAAPDCDVVGEVVPVVCAADDVGVVHGACALRGPVGVAECDRGGDVLARHDEPEA